MADYYTTGTVSPEIPCEFITAEDIEFIKRFGFETEEFDKSGVKHCYFYAPEYSSVALDIINGEEIEIGEEKLFRVFQKILRRSKGKLPYIYLSFVHTCSRYRPDGFGGSAVFITDKTIKWVSTWGWLSKQKGKAERNNKERE